MRTGAGPVLVALLCLPLCACAYAPAFNLLGSYFPAWMLCALLGIVFAVLIRLVVNRFNLQAYARPTVLTYPCTAFVFASSLWLLFFS